MTMSTMVPTKSTGNFIARRVIAFFRECGLDKAKIVVRCDQEAAVTAILDRVKENQAANGILESIVPEWSPVGSHQSNGAVERGVQAVEGQVRTLRDALESRIG